LIQNSAVFLDFKNSKIHLGSYRPESFINKTLNGFLEFLNQIYPERQIFDVGHW
jgi:hypothetical protein